MSASNNFFNSSQTQADLALREQLKQLKEETSTLVEISNRLIKSIWKIQEKVSRLEQQFKTEFSDEKRAQLTQKILKLRECLLKSETDLQAPEIVKLEEKIDNNMAEIHNLHQTLGITFPESESLLDVPRKG